MAKQTINIGTAPNDGTGTPLRTSFDYCNLNFTELYTALGGGVGLPGATTQVIFNDGGTNLAGDAGLVYNKCSSRLRHHHRRGYGGDDAGCDGCIDLPINRKFSHWHRIAAPYPQQWNVINANWRQCNNRSWYCFYCWIV